MRRCLRTAIMTTDTKMKVARAVVDVDGTEVRIFGVAKGAGMIHPQLGAPVRSAARDDAGVPVYRSCRGERRSCAGLLEPAVEGSFNSISIDGDTSTNDTVLLLASGASGVKLDERVGEAFANALKLVCESLAHQIVDDGEGVGHVVTLQITGARTEAEAKQVAKSIAHSPAVQDGVVERGSELGTAAGGGGILRRGVRSGAGDGSRSASMPVFELGVTGASFDKAAAHEVMIGAGVHDSRSTWGGEAECTFLTCDLTEEYVRINADYSS